MVLAMEWLSAAGVTTPEEQRKEGGTDMQLL